MKLSSDLCPTSAPGSFGGNLHLNFSTLNPRDWRPSPPQWITSAKTSAFEAYALPTGDQVVVNLNLISPPNGQLGIQGAIAVHTAGNLSTGPQLGGVQAKGFLPNQPNPITFTGTANVDVNGTKFHLGFTLKVPWDGTAADCTGTWWAVWGST